MEEEKKQIEVVSGDGSNLDITPVYNHISGEKRITDKEKPKNIVIPKSNSEESNNSNHSKKSDDPKNTNEDKKN